MRPWWCSDAYRASVRKRSAATGKVPEPQAGSQTLRARISSGGLGVQATAGASRSGGPSGSCGGVVGERPQRALHRGHGQPGPRVEGAGRPCACRPSAPGTTRRAAPRGRRAGAPCAATASSWRQAPLGRERAPRASVTSLPTSTARRAHVLGARARDVAFVAGVAGVRSAASVGSSASAVSSCSSASLRPSSARRRRLRRPPRLRLRSPRRPAAACPSSSRAAPRCALSSMRLEARQRQRRLVADGEEDDRVARRAPSSARSRAGPRRGCRCTRSRGPRSRPAPAPRCCRGPGAA